MSAEIFQMLPASSLKTGDVFRPLKWNGAAAGTDYVVEQSRLVPYCKHESGTIFIALPIHIFTAPHPIYGPVRKKLQLEFRESAGLVLMKGNLLDHKQCHIPSVGALVVRSGRKRRNGRRALKGAMVESVWLTPPSSFDPLHLQVYTNKFNMLGFYPQREDAPHYKITDSSSQRLAL